MATGVSLEGITKAPQPTLHILSISLDLKLCWGPHVKHTVEQVFFYFYLILTLVVALQPCRSSS